MQGKREWQDWVRVVEEYEKSGLTQRGFAERRGIGLSTLVRAVGRVRRERSDQFGGFVQVVEGPVAVVGEGVEVREAQRPVRVVVGGVKMELWELPSPEYVAVLARAVAGGAPC